MDHTKSPRVRELIISLMSSSIQIKLFGFEYNEEQF